MRHEETYQNCSNNFPLGLCNYLVTPDYPPPGRKMCPICANDQINAIHGLPNGTAFRGEIAEQLRQEAIHHRKTKATS